MGYEQREMTVTVRLSRHNSDRDAEHERLWERMKMDIERVADNPDYADIDPYLS